jgi:hypothetical protein
MTKTRKELQNALPGYDKRDVILSEKRANGHNKTLTLVYCIRGFFKKLSFAHNFWVETHDDVGPVCQTFDSLDKAVTFYAKLS